MLRVDEGGQPIRPVYAEAMSMCAGPAGAPPPPVEAGTIEIGANIALTVEIAP